MSQKHPNKFAYPPHTHHDSFFFLYPMTNPPTNTVGSNFKIYPESMTISEHLHLYYLGTSHHHLLSSYYCESLLTGQCLFSTKLPEWSFKNVRDIMSFCCCKCLCNGFKSIHIQRIEPDVLTWHTNLTSAPGYFSNLLLIPLVPSLQYSSQIGLFIDP